MPASGRTIWDDTKPIPETVDVAPSVSAGGFGARQAGSVLTVDLDAVRANYRLLRTGVSSAECAAVVKADGYGLGAVPIATALQAEGCKTFFVAHLAEGLALKPVLGSYADVYILNGLPPGAEGDCAAAGLVPVLNSLEQLAAWRGQAARIGQKLPAAIQVDSGMARLGMAPSEVDRLAADTGLLAGIEPKLVMSHFACADEPTHPANAEQLRRFHMLRRKLPPDVRASLANSSGIFLGSKTHFDLVRPGAALYGINPVPGRANPMRPVVQLHAKVIQTRDLPAGEGIGYGHTVTTAGPTRAATISIGYADGWQRSAVGSAFFAGVPLPFLGRVSMDSIVLDIDAAGDLLGPGDLVELIGPNRSVDEVAALAGTIGYEVLTNLGQRFHRRYPGAEVGP